eukprot:3562163-Ditylum_brightwellii.AAC.1
MEEQLEKVWENNNGYDVLLDKGGSGAQSEVDYQREEDGEGEFEEKEDHDDDNRLHHPLTMNEYESSLQPFDLTGDEDAPTSPPMCRSTRDKRMSLQALKSIKLEI